MSEPSSFVEARDQMLEAINSYVRHDNQYPLFLAPLFRMERAHNEELKEAMHGFFDELSFDELDPGELSVQSIKSHELKCDRESVMRRLTEYYENPPKVSHYGIWEDGGAPTLFSVLQIIMYPNSEWSFHDLYHRLMYLLGGDLDE